MVNRLWNQFLEINFVSIFKLYACLFLDFLHGLNLPLKQTEPRYMESRMKEINFLISLAWVEGGRDVGDPMLKIEKCCEGVRAPPTTEKSEN